MRDRPDLPGIDSESINVTVEQHVLTVEARRPAHEGVEWTFAERQTGSFTRQIVLADCSPEIVPLRARRVES